MNTVVFDIVCHITSTNYLKNIIAADTDIMRHCKYVREYKEDEFKHIEFESDLDTDGLIFEVSVCTKYLCPNIDFQEVYRKLSSTNSFICPDIRVQINSSCQDTINLAIVIDSTIDHQTDSTDIKEYQMDRKYSTLCEKTTKVTKHKLTKLQGLFNRKDLFSILFELVAPDIEGEHASFKVRKIKSIVDSIFMTYDTTLNRDALKEIKARLTIKDYTIEINVSYLPEE